jgi:hypothetical protein
MVNNQRFAILPDTTDASDATVTNTSGESLLDLLHVIGTHQLTDPEMSFYVIGVSF